MPVPRGKPAPVPSTLTSASEPLGSAYRAFIDAHPDYVDTARLDTLRASDFRRLDLDAHVYLDYTGAGLYGAEQIRQHAALLRSRVLGNPHSVSAASSAATALVERARTDILRYFNAPTEEFTAVFTQNATAALKLVGEAYPFTPRSRLLLTFDNHNSVNGIREYARARHAVVDYAPLDVPELRIVQPQLDDLLAKADSADRNLFAFPAQSNFSGVKHPLDLVDRAHSKGWDVLLDAAAYVPTSRLDLASVKADFVTVSFYKMFGYPTGVGCLIARRAALSALARPWFAGGTVNFASVRARAHVLAPAEAGFEDGTLNFLSIPAVTFGLQYLERVGIDVIAVRVRCLTGWLLQQLLALRHDNGRPLVRIYGPANTTARGGAITLNFYDPDGHLLDYRRVEELATDARISLRTGCFCNPGAGEIAEGLTEADMLAGLEAGADISLPHFMQIVQHRGGKSAGAIRISLGLVSNFTDVYRFVTFAAGFRNQSTLTIGAVSFDIESCRVIRDGS